jgi:hypothetical protein
MVVTCGSNRVTTDEVGGFGYVLSAPARGVGDVPEKWCLA